MQVIIRPAQPDEQVEEILVPATRLPTSLKVLIITQPILFKGLGVILRSAFPDVVLTCVEPQAFDLRVQRRQHFLEMNDITIIDSDQLEIQIFEDMGHTTVQRLGNIILMVSHPTEEVLFQALKYGTKALVSALIEPDQLLVTIHAVMEGQWMITEDILQDRRLNPKRSAPSPKQPESKSPHRVSARAKRVVPWPPIPAQVALTNREREILQELACGKSNREIARKHEISFHTLKNILYDLYQKLEANNRCSAVINAIRAKLIPLPTEQKENHVKRGRDDNSSRIPRRAHFTP